MTNVTKVKKLLKLMKEIAYEGMELGDNYRCLTINDLLPEALEQLEAQGITIDCDECFENLHKEY